MDEYNITNTETRSGGKYVSRKKKSRRILYFAIGFFAIAVIAAIGMIFYTLYHVNIINAYEFIFPNVFITNVDVGGMTTDDAISLVTSRVLNSYNASLTVELPGKTLVFSSDNTKVSTYIDDAVQQAYVYGREGSKSDIARAYKQAEKTDYYIDIDMSLSIDHEQVLRIIEETAQELNCQLVNTEHRVENNKIIISVGTSQKSLDTESLYNAVISAFANEDFTTINFDIDKVNPTAVDLDLLYQQLCVEPVDAVYNKSTGEITSEVVGKYFDVESARQHLALAAEGSEYVIELQEAAPAVTKSSLDAMLFRNILGSYSTPLTNSTSGRTTNVTLACEAVNGKIFLPGESFSFNGVVGERTTEKGYASASVYVGGLTVQEPGGGVCQVSSTIYLACLLGNLQIVDRECHQFLVTYMPKGLDATVYWGYQDFVFKNDTDYPLRVDANVSGGQVNVTIYGTKTDDTYVEMTSEVLSTTAPDYITETDPTKPVGYSDVTQTAYTGYVVKTYRNIYNGDGTLISSSLEATSYYQKRDQKTIIGSAEDSENIDLPVGNEETIDTETYVEPISTEDTQIVEAASETEIPSEGTELAPSGDEMPVSMPVDDLLDMEQE